jgi:hypothetical protein
MARKIRGGKHHPPQEELDQGRKDREIHLEDYHLPQIRLKGQAGHPDLRCRKVLEDAQGRSHEDLLVKIGSQAVEPAQGQGGIETILESSQGQIKAGLEGQAKAG